MSAGSAARADGVVLVTGASGALGSAVVARLAARGEAVRALVRPGPSRAELEALGAEIARGDLGDERSLRHALRGVARLVHAAELRGADRAAVARQRALHVEGTARLYRAAHDHGVGRIVHVSTTATLGGTRDGSALDETASCNLRSLAHPYVESKLEGEQRALACAWAGMPVVVVLPAVCVGPDAPAARAVAALARGRLGGTLPGGLSLADLDDVADALVAALDRGRPGERYALGGPGASWLELGCALARAGVGRAPRRALPALAARWVGAAARCPLGGELARFAPWFTCARSEKAAAELGYRVRTLEELCQRLTRAPRAQAPAAAREG